MSQAERRFVELGAAGGGHGPFRGLEAPCALESTVGEIGGEVNGTVRHCHNEDSRARLPHFA